MAPALPKSFTHAYAPMKGADMDERMIKSCRVFLPFISYILYRYARGTPNTREKKQAAMATLKLFVRVLK